MIENSSITITIFSWMLNNLNLSGVELLVFSILCSIGETTASQLSEFVGMNERATVYNLNKLLEKECIVKVGGTINGKRTPVCYAAKKEYEILYENLCKKLYEISYLREKEAKREDIKEDYHISYSLNKENEVKDIDYTSDSNDIVKGDKDNIKVIKCKGISNNQSNKDIQKDKINRFIPPTVEEVRAYCIEKGYDIDPEDFVNFYESKNWYVGKNKMVKWKSSCALWANKDKKKQQKTEAKKAQSYDIDEFVNAAIKRAGAK